MTTARTNQEITAIYQRQVLLLYRVCFTYLKNSTEAQEAVQDTFLQLIKTNPTFTSLEHDKAWLLRTAINLCKNRLRHWFYHHDSLTTAIEEQTATQDDYDETLASVLHLPAKYRGVLYLYYYEGYSTKEIASLLRRPPSTIRNYLMEARRLLQQELGADY